MTLPIAADVASDALSGFAEILEVPVHVLAVLLLAVLVYEAGGLLVEGWRRVRPSAEPLELLARRALQDPAAAPALARLAPGPLTEHAILDLAEGGDAEGREQALTAYELRIQRRLDRTRMLVRAGPALGLMGTLIPLAPGLRSLGDGDFQQLAGDLETAFAATVVGILVGTGAYVLTLVRTRRCTEDLAALERAIAVHGAPHHRVETVAPVGAVTV